MKLIAAFPFRHHSTLVCDEAKKLLTNAGFALACNDTGRKLTRQEQKELIRDAFAIVAGTEQYDADMLSACKNLRVIIRFGVGLDNFDMEEMRRRGIQIGVISNCNAVAEFTLTLILAAMKNLPRYDAAVREGAWSRFPMCELGGKTVGLVGFGRIGKRLAQLLSGFGVRLLISDPYAAEADVALCGGTLVPMDTLLQQSHIVSLHLPSTKETRHIMDKAAFAKMRDGAYFINTSRGALVDETALLEALQSGKLSGAGLDVYEQEPVTRENPLFTLPNVVLAPHVSALTYETNYNGGLICAKSILNVLGGGTPLFPV